MVYYLNISYVILFCNTPNEKYFILTDSINYATFYTMRERLYRLKDIEKQYKCQDRNLFIIRLNLIKKGKQIGTIVDRCVMVTAAERDYLLSRLGKRGRGNWLDSKK